MDGASWRPTQGADPASVAAAAGVDLNSPDWRAQLQPEARSRIVNKIMETLKKHLPVTVPEGLSELQRIAVRFEENMYTAATNQSDYLRKISMKMLSMESQANSQQSRENAQVIPNQNPPSPGVSINDSMDAAIGVTSPIPWRQSQDGPADNHVVNLIARSPIVENRRRCRRGASTAAAAGARSSPIDVEALQDQAQRTNWREPGTVVDVEADTSQEGNKRQRVVPVVTSENSSLQSNEEHAKEPTFTCPICWNKLEEASTTICGHIFCTKCIKQAIQVQKECPICRRHLRKNNFHRVFLPNIDS